MRPNPWLQKRFTLLFAAGLALLEYVFYFHSNSHFFQGDTIYYFYLRHRTIPDFLMSFFRLDPAGWFRPLASRSVQSLLFPAFGLDPTLYRIVQYLLFFCVLAAVYKLADVVTGRRLAACLAAAYFCIHTVNAYTTYDVAFTPEIVYTLFYVCTVIAYLRYRESSRAGFLVASVVCFIASLWSKEAAVTLPVMIILLDVILNRRQIRPSIAGARPHLVVLVVYLLFVIGYLGAHHSAFHSIIARPGPEINYRFALDRTILTNADFALTWAFNIPRGWHSQWRGLNGWMLAFLKAFRLVTALLAVWLLFQPERKIVVAGFVWFFAALTPALPLFEHFIPYYLFLPVVGFSIAIGTIFDAAYRKASSYSPSGAAVALASASAILAGICYVSVRNDTNGNRILGWSSRLALNSVNDLKALHPTLKPNTTIYVSDAAEPQFAWDISDGALFKMEYGDETIQTLFWSWDGVITKEVMDRGPVVVVRNRQFHLDDVTHEFLAASEPPVSYRAPGENRLQVSPAVANAGETYRVDISGLPNSDVTVHYSFNGGPIHAMTVHLDSNHAASLNISESTEKGIYRFAGFRMPGTADWIQAAASIQVN